MKSLGDLIVRSVVREAIMFPMKIFYELKPKLTMEEADEIWKFICKISAHRKHAESLSQKRLVIIFHNLLLLPKEKNEQALEHIILSLDL